MLKQFSRLEKTRSLIIIFFAAILVLGLVVAGVYNRTGAAIANPLKSREVIAEVGGDHVTVADLALRKRLYEQRMGGQFSLAQLGMTDERVLDSLINDRIVGREAERLGLAPSPAEVAETIRRQFADDSGKFDLKRYKDTVARNYGSVPLFEKQMRDGLAAEKLRAYISAGVQVSEQDVQSDWQRRNTTFDLVYVPVVASDLAKGINPADDELQKYYEEHKTDFRILEPQKRVRYLYVNQEKAGQKLQIGDEDLRKEYDQLKPENKMAGVRVQQIVLRVARPELDPQVLQKATELAARARGEGNDLKATAEEFAELARGNSEDPATAKEGGWLPGLVRKNPNKPNDLLQNTLEFEEGYVGDPLKTGNAYYIFRRGEAVPKSFEDARQELLVSLRNRRSYAVAAQLAARAADRLKETKDFQKVAQELAAEANMGPAEMVRETPFVKPGDDVPEIGSNPQFEQTLAPLDEQGEFGERVAVKGGFAIPMLLEVREPRTPELAEVREKVVEAYRLERAKQQVEQSARQLAEAAASAADLKAAAERLGLKAETAEAHKLGSPLGSVGADPSADAAIYNLKPGEVTKTPIKVEDSWVVVGATKRTDADLAEFGKQREGLIQSAQTQRRNEVFDEYVASIRRRLDEAGEIEIKKDVLEKMAETEEPPVAVPRSPINIPPQSGQ